MTDKKMTMGSHWDIDRKQMEQDRDLLKNIRAHAKNIAKNQAHSLAKKAYLLNLLRHQCTQLLELLDAVQEHAEQAADAKIGWDTAVAKTWGEKWYGKKEQWK